MSLFFYFINAACAGYVYLPEVGYSQFENHAPAGFIKIIMVLVNICFNYYTPVKHNIGP
jgi:hypothetical protein